MLLELCWLQYKSRSLSLSYFYRSPFFFPPANYQNTESRLTFKRLTSPTSHPTWSKKKSMRKILQWQAVPCPWSKVCFPFIVGLQAKREYLTDFHVLIPKTRESIQFWSKPSGYRAFYEQWKHVSRRQDKQGGKVWEPAPLLISAKCYYGSCRPREL